MYYNKKEKGETPTVKDGIRKDVFYREKNLKTGSFAFRRRIDTDCTDRLLAQRHQQFGEGKKSGGSYPESGGYGTEL